MAFFAFGNDLDGFEPTLTQAAYYRTVGKQGHPVNWKPDHYASIGTLGDDTAPPNGAKVRMRSSS